MALFEEKVPAVPFPLFEQWLDEALAAGLHEPYAMTLATALPDGTPSARVVLLRGYGPEGFLFFTNYTSRKAGELAVNPQAALVLYWGPLERQVRIEGKVQKTTERESDDYFHARPFGHRLNAVASPQSQTIEGRELLQKRMDEMAAQFAEGQVPRPSWWGGYRLIPHTIEFWQGQANRLHDRLRYRLRGEEWLLERLAP